ncbi:hypothetical protein, partial [Brevundimonas naejangsanensis]|uniref:hypothetical protein n=1 Tax=Brevundimonas naejangsanensis TaxID=588932 RepID=UPI0026EDE71A
GAVAAAGPADPRAALFFAAFLTIVKVPSRSARSEALNDQGDRGGRQGGQQEGVAQAVGQTVHHVGFSHGLHIGLSVKAHFLCVYVVPLDHCCDLFLAFERCGLRS